MIKFDPTALRVEYAALSHITTALKGSMRLVELDDDGNDKETRHKIPFAVARSWKEEYKVTKYLVPIPVAVVYYGDMVVYVEKGPVMPEYMREDPENYGSLFGDKPFTARVEECVHHMQTMQANGEWHTDGFSVYDMPTDLELAFEQHGTALTADHKFRSLSVDIIKFSELGLISNVKNPSSHTVVCIKNEAGKVFATPPIFKNIADMRQSDMKVKKAKKDETPTNDQLYRLDLIDKNFDVNLEFALAAGNTVGRNYGYKAVGPLRLEKLMLALTTVNLPNIKQSVRTTFPVGMSFLQAYAWLTGMINQSSDMQTLIEMRALIKTLCTKGIFKKNVIERVFRKDEHGKVQFDKPEMVSLEDLKDLAKNQSDTTRRSIIDSVIREKKDKKSRGTDATGMDVSD
ncbi:MAG: hypothetical protein JXR12_06565 [Neptunomonas phycophila]|uniref:hypothetical protein n=1 Tax=Neptunomonas phycophila TaxID=1572645 RepID=UPI003B8C5B23